MNHGHLFRKSKLISINDLSTNREFIGSINWNKNQINFNFFNIILIEFLINYIIQKCYNCKSNFKYRIDQIHFKFFLKFIDDFKQNQKIFSH